MDKPDNNVMRRTYKELSPKDMENILRIKDTGTLFYTLCEELGPSREISLAMTKVEEAVMWATKHITK